jgi:hypothetical protein
MPQADPAERVVDRREPGADAGAALDLGSDLDQRQVGGRQDQAPQQGFAWREQPPPMSAVAGRSGTSGRLHPLHQLDRSRGRNIEASRGFTDRATAPHGPDDPLPEVQGNWGWHDDISMFLTNIVESHDPIPRNRNML